MAGSRVQFGECLRDFYEIIVKDYPELTLEQLRKICVSPYQVIREAVSGDDFTPVRIRYLGLFCVLKGKVQSFKRNVKRGDFKDGEKYDKMMNSLDVYLKKFEIDE